MRFSKLLAVALATVPVFASAADVNSSFIVRATVVPACSVTATDVTVASYDPNAAAPTTATSTVNVTCTKGTTFHTTLSSANKFLLTGAGTDTLSYQIFQGAGTTGTVWANATTSNQLDGTAKNKNATPFTATIAIDAGQDVLAGTYSDTVTVNVNY